MASTPKNKNMLWIAACALAVMAALYWQSLQTDPVDRAPVNDAPHLQTTVVADNLEFPWSVAFLPGGQGFLVTERGGKLLHIAADGKTRKEIAGLPDIYAAGQGGLFDVTLSPDFARDSTIFFAYAGGDENANSTELARARLDLAAAQLSDVKTIFVSLPKVKSNQHFGGRILFLPDGTLLLTLGDRYSMRDHAQNVTDDLGTTVRLTRDGGIPKDNPFAATAGAKPEIFTYGHRNVQGAALYPGTNAIWIHEHGPRGGDEINILRPGANYGWPVVTYGREYSGATITDVRHKDGMQDPLVHWTPSIAPSGMAFYTGDKMPQWKGDLFVGALAGQHLRRLDIEGGHIIKQEKLLTTLESRIRDVRQGPDGYLYLLTDAPDGQLLRYGPKH